MKTSVTTHVIGFVTTALELKKQAFSISYLDTPRN